MILTTIVFSSQFEINMKLINNVTIVTTICILMITNVWLATAAAGLVI
jgi:hypothetical protein